MALGIAGLDGARAESARQPGQYDLGVSTRTFDSPLFGNSNATTFRFFGNQSFAGGGDYQVWLSGGIADYTTNFGLRGDGILAGSQTLGFGVGDYSLESLLPDSAPRGLNGFYPLRGANLGGRGEGFSWRAFAGGTLHDLSVPGREGTRPALYGGQVLASRGANSFGADLVVVEDAAFADPARDGERDGVLTGRYFRQISPWTHLFTELSGASQGFGARVGASLRLLRGDLTTAVYGYGDGLPYVYPLFRPGETGLELRGRYRVTGWATTYGSLYYATDDAIRERDELRGTTGVSMNFGPGLPTLSVDYSHDDLVYPTLDEDREGTLADRLALTYSRARNAGYLGVTAEQLFSSRAGDLDRSQAFVVYRRALGSRTLLDGSAVVQRDERSDFGTTAEAAFERPLRGAFSYLAGLGAGYVERSGTESGEGVLRVGLARRSRTGWYARIEARIPFSIGLERSQLNRQSFALDVGHRFRWDDLGSALFHRDRRRADSGELGGRVVVDGADAGGIVVVVNGMALATTRRDGTFAVRDVPAGEAYVTLDLRALEPGFDVRGDRARVVNVSPGITSYVDFDVERFSSIQGALVRCEDERLAAVKAVEVTLSSATELRSVTTSTVGGFQFDHLPPGSYELSVAPDVAGAGFVPQLVDLTEDVYGYVLELDCPAPHEVGRGGLENVGPRP